MKKLFSVFLVIMMVFITSTVAFANTSDTYSTYVSGCNDKLYSDYVKELSARGIIEDDSYENSDPKDFITYSEFLNLLAAVANVDLSTYGEQITSEVIDKNSCDSKEMQWAFETGLIRGDGDVISSTSYITRESMATIVERFGNNTDGFEFPHVRDEVHFKDYSDISDWAERAVNDTVCSEILDSNEENYFLPRNFANREETVNAIWMLYVYLQGFEIQKYLLTHDDDINNEIEAAQSEMQRIDIDQESKIDFNNKDENFKIGTPINGFSGGGFQFLDGDILYTNGTFYFGHIGIACGDGILEILKSGIHKISYSTWKNRYSDRYTYVLRRIPEYCNGNTNCRQVSINAAWYGKQYFLEGKGKLYKWQPLLPLSSTTYINCSGLAYKCYRDGAGFYYKCRYINNATDSIYYADPVVITPADIFQSRVYNGFSAIYKF